VATDDGPEAGHGDALTGEAEVVHADHSLDRFDHLEVDHRVHLDRHVVLRYDRLRRNIDHLDTKRDLHQPVDYGNPEDEPGPFGVGTHVAQTEEDRSFVLGHNPKGRRDKNDRDEEHRDHACDDPHLNTRRGQERYTTAAHVPQSRARKPLPGVATHLRDSPTNQRRAQGGWMRVVVTGSSGLIGIALLVRLRREGHQVIPLVRRSPDAGAAHWDPAVGTIDAGALERADAVVNLAGVGIGDRRWSAARKEAILSSRVSSTTLLCETVAGLTRSPPVLVNASAIGFYGDQGDELLTEDSPAGTGFVADVCRAWEAATSPARQAGVRVVHLRTAVVLARHGGALARQLPLFRLGLGGRLARGDQWLSWISLRDEVRAILHILGEESLVGATNCSSSAPVTNAQFTRALGRAVHRPAALVVPRSALRLALGHELADELVLTSQRVMPTRLEASGFSFEDPSIDEALAAVLAP